MRSDTVFKLAFNRTLEHLSVRPDLPLSESGLGRLLGVSRTTSRKVLAQMNHAGITMPGDGGPVRRRAPVAADKYPLAETTPRGIHVERRVMEWILHVDTRPGTIINELELSRQFKVATGAIREFLIRLSHYGLVEKKPNAGWLFHGFTKSFAMELFEVRVLFEGRSIRYFLDLPDSSPLWADLQTIRADHEALLIDIDARFHDFSELDDRFHRLITSVRPNRFIADFHGIIALIFHYHYQWNKRSERVRNQVALTEHLAIIDALQSRDGKGAEQAAMAHLESARATLTKSLGFGP